MKKNIFLFGIINAAVFIGLFFAFKYLNLRNITGLRIINYVVLAIISIIQIHKLIKDNKGYIPFLQAYFISFFTGTFSFFIFAIFIYIYSWSDPYLNVLFIMDSDNLNKMISAMLVFFEGSGGSIIISLITMFYASRFEDGEAEI